MLSDPFMFSDLPQLCTILWVSLEAAENEISQEGRKVCRELKLRADDTLDSELRVALGERGDSTGEFVGEHSDGPDIDVMIVILP